MTLTRQGGKGLSAVSSAWDILPFTYTGQSPLIRQHPAVRVHSCSELGAILSRPCPSPYRTLGSDLLVPYVPVSPARP